MRTMLVLSVLLFPLGSRACPMEEATAAKPAATGIETAQAPSGVIDVTIPLRSSNRAPASVPNPAKTAPETPEN